MPDFSVIIPNYNHSGYLHDRIDSVLAQLYDSFEVIILDDHSSDNSRDVIEAYRSHPKVAQIIYNKENTGNTFKQWQKGIEMATGNWIWVAESDDWCEPTFLSEMNYLIQKYPKTSLAYCQSLRVYKDGKLSPTYTEILESNLNGHEWIVKYMLGNCFLENASMAVFRKSLVHLIDERFIKFRQCGDWYFWCQLATLGTVSVSGKYLNYFRKHSSNVTTTNWKEGYFFSEGSRIFKELISQLQLTDQEVQFGLKRFLSQLQSNQSIFSADKYKELMKDVISIDPTIVRQLLRQQKKLERRQELKALLRKLLPI